MYTLRPYQAAAVGSVYLALRERDDNLLVVLPTGAGKSIILAQIALDAVSSWSGRVLILTHVRELIEQNADKVQRLCPQLNVGINSAGLGRRDVDAPVICAGIQSVFDKACELGPFDLILVDEAHLINDLNSSRYAQFLAEMRIINPRHRVIGLTATPYRLDSGPLCGPGRMFGSICYEIGVRELIVQGYLSPLISKAGGVSADTDRLHVRGGEFVPSELEAIMDESELVTAACAEIVERTRDRNSVLIFTCGVLHGRHVVEVLRANHGVECEFVTGQTPSAERDRLLERFRTGDLKYLANVNVLTTGFDAPQIDCVALLRPTLSPGLFYQMVGRGFRLHPGKPNCLILDFGGNVLRHGPVDAIRVAARSAGNEEPPAKQCPECRTLLAAGYSVCPECGFEFPPRSQSTHDATASDAGILTGEVHETRCGVIDIRYAVHVKCDAPPGAPRSMRVEYRIGRREWQSEWVCFEHSGYARERASEWWRRRSPDPVPETAQRAVELAESGALSETRAIVVRSVSGERFDQIVSYELGPRPEPIAVDDSSTDDDVPF